ncbi:hypothetical protein TRIP_C20763 [Candidatus Zixiibacteriota bacterium]|nr:hypothetical protein TRIP_C20763 [candidate division Zixibacteria bacterium]
MNYFTYLAHYFEAVVGFYDRKR